MQEVLSKKIFLHRTFVQKIHANREIPTPITFLNGVEILAKNQFNPYQTLSNLITVKEGEVFNTLIYIHLCYKDSKEKCSYLRSNFKSIQTLIVRFGCMWCLSRTFYGVRTAPVVQDASLKMRFTLPTY